MLMLGLARRQTVCRLFLYHVTAWGKGREEGARFQNNKLMLGLARRHTIWDLLFTSRDLQGATEGRGRLGLFTCDVRGSMNFPNGTAYWYKY